MKLDEVLAGEIKPGQIIEFSCNGKGRGGHYRVSATVTKVKPKTVEATEANRSYKPGTLWNVHRDQILKVRDPLPGENHKSLGESMKVKEVLLKEASNNGEHEWAKSKWWPKKLDPDLSPTKVAFDAMVKEAVKTWPKGMRDYLTHEGVGVGGNGIFDSIRGLMHEFEEAEHDFADIPLQNFYDDIVKFGAAFEEYYRMLEAFKPKLEALAKNKRIKTYADYVAAVSKIKVPAVSLFTSEHLHIVLSVWDGTDVAYRIREGKYDEKLKKSIPGEDKQYMPRDATSEFKFDSNTAMLRLFDVVLHLVGWAEVLGIYETVSLKFKTEPLQTLLPEDQFIDWHQK